jgi:carbon monoxide dehydrogenase subunit G
MAMELDNSFTVPVPPDQAWDVLLDVKRIAPCMPGATVDEVDGDVVTGRIKVKVGPVSLTYRGTAKFIERDPEARVVVMEASGKETRGAGTASATVRASLAPDATGDGTDVTMHTTMNVTGRPAQFGRGVMVEVGGKLVDQFAVNLANLIAGDTAADADAGNPDAAAAAPGVSEVSEVSEVSGESADGAGPSAATAEVASGNGAGSGESAATAGTAAAAGAATTAGTAVPVVSAADAPQEDSLNLVKLVGPAILKRVLPVVVAAAGLAVLGGIVWRLRRRRPEQAD